MEIKVCKIELEDLKLSSSYAAKIRGYVGNKYREYTVLHNHLQDKFIYRYPKVQYKVIKNKPIIIGINEATDIISNIALKDDKIILNDKEYNIYQKKIEKYTQDIKTVDDYVTYEFLTPWVALNQNNISKYNKSNNMEKEDLLKKILIGNVLSLAKGLDYTIDKKINCWINLSEVYVNLKGIKHKAFKGQFKINIEIPDYFGIGKSVSRGFGAIKKLN